MHQRGPDGRGSFQDDKVFLGHRRLSIIDLTEGGAQPMFSGDRNHVIVFNGEIYNYIELKEELQKQGIVFKSTSDTEVLLESIAKRGLSGINALNGMFAFALWDRKNESMLVVRDRIGIKPVYYIDTDKFTAFASDIRALLPLLEDVRINDGIVYDFLSRARVDHSSETFFQGITKLTPGSFALVKNNRLKISQWYNLESRVERLRSEEAFKTRNDREHILKVKELFRDAVRIRLRSDVPVGSCLSGGIDSSSIVVTAISMIPQEELQNFQSFSAVFGEWYSKDETKYIEAVKEKSGIQGLNITPTPEMLDQMFDQFITNQEEPVTGASPFSQYCVMQLAHSNDAKVLLDGQGADEILAGYDFMMGFYFAELLYKGKFHRLLKEVYIQLKRRNKYAIRTGISQYLPNFLRKYARVISPLINTEFVRKHKNRKVLGPVVIRPPSLRYALIQYVTIHIQHLLKWEDKNSMAYSIETRLPFLDYRFLEYILALPARLIVKNGITKWILREALNDKLPSIVTQRTDKIGFATPEYEWLRSGSVQTITNLKEKNHKKLKEYVNIDVLHHLLSKAPESIDSETWNYAFRIAALNSWLQSFFPNASTTIQMTN
jgi:asparagine synthase (glutamine-hydrolysing)